LIEFQPDLMIRVLQRQRSKNVFECVPNATTGASACFSCSVGHYANASGDWRRLSTVTMPVDGLLMNAARLGDQMAVPRFHGTGSTTG
jgi:hypothetical protein